MSESTGPEPGPHVCHGARGPGGSLCWRRSTQSLLFVQVQGDSVLPLECTQITSMISSSTRRSSVIPCPSDAEQSEVHNLGPFIIPRSTQGVGHVADAVYRTVEHRQASKRTCADVYPGERFAGAIYA